jgi:hypothetical protein
MDDLESDAFDISRVADRVSVGSGGYEIVHRRRGMELRVDEPIASAVIPSS